MINKRFKNLFFLLIFLLIPITGVDAKVSCSDISVEIDNYETIVNNMKDLDCNATENSENVSKCNEYNKQKAQSLSKLFSYNDEKINCKSKLKSIIKENKDQCVNVFGTELKDIANEGMKIFYVVAPFLLIIFGMLDFSKIVVMSDPNTIKESRKKFVRRLICFLLVFLIPGITRLFLNFNVIGIDYNSTIYSCKSNIVFHLDRWETIYIPQSNTAVSSSNSSVTASGNWHTDWFQGDSRWGSHPWAGGSGNIKGGGCGSLATSIVCAHYKGDDSTSSYCYPYNTADEYYNKGKQPNLDSDAITTFFNSWHPELGLQATKYYNEIDLNKLDSVLAAGGCAIADFQSDITYNGVPVWTTGGHYVTIFAGNQKDGYRVADSNGGHDSGYSGIAAWAPYGNHVFEKEYIKSPWYYYLIEKK